MNDFAKNTLDQALTLCEEQQAENRRLAEIGERSICSAEEAVAIILVLESALARRAERIAELEAELTKQASLLVAVRRWTAARSGTDESDRAARDVWRWCETNGATAMASKVLQEARAGAVPTR